ncbi:muscleblind-like protein 3 isoform X3 [Mirounga angustirostris]|uniref:muscleblind-like protein 3 isoform X3 n=1 Tax=Mirounga angustirostris TaxID=9716 RepID=UPI00313C4BAD
MFAQQMQFMVQNAHMSSLTSFPMNPSLAANPAMAFNPYLPHPGMGLVPAELVPNAPVLISGNPPLVLPAAAGPKLMRSDKLEMNHSASAAMALQPGMLQLIPQRSALEKTNGATPVFNPSVFHCQQALANLQLPQPAFIPAGPILCMAPASSVVPMMHSAAPTTVSAAPTPATSVPFAATATGNQIPPLSVDELNSSMFVSQM